MASLSQKRSWELIGAGSLSTLSTRIFSNFVGGFFFEFCAVISIIQYLLSREKLAVH